MIQRLLQQLPEWFAYLAPWPVAIQIVIALLLPLFGLWLRRLSARRLEAIQQQVVDSSIFRHAPWLISIFVLVDRIIIPLTAWIIGRIAIVALRQYGLPTAILEWTVPFLVMWMLYVLLTQIVQLRFTATQASTWKKHILRPAFLILVALHATGMLDDILNYEINLNKSTLTTLQSVTLGAVVMVLFLLASSQVRGLLRDVILPQTGMDPSVNQIISTFSSYAVTLFGFWMGLTVAGIDVTTLTFIIGGISIGIGFGMQELINNFISGFILLLERSLVPGDVLMIKNTLGVVEEIKLRTMKIRTEDDVELIVPNGMIFGDIVVNYNQARARRKKRIHVRVSASYKNDPHQVMALLHQAADHHPLVVKRPQPRVLITDFGDNGIHYDLLVWIGDAMKIPSVQSDLRLRIWDLFKEAGVEMPFPQRDVHLYTPGEIDEGPDDNDA